MCRFMFVSQDLYEHASHPAWLTAFGDLYTVTRSAKASPIVVMQNQTWLPGGPMFENLKHLNN